MAQAIGEGLATPPAGLIEALAFQTGPISSILCGMADNANLSLVCEAFGRHNRNAMQQELREIRMTDAESVQWLRTTENALPPDVRSVDELAQEITHKLVDSPFLNEQDAVLLKDQLQSIWWRCEELRRSLTPAEADQTRPLWQKAFHDLNEQLTDAELPHGNRNFVAHMQALKELCLRLRVMHRFNQVVRTQGLNIEDRAQTLRCFSALQESQKVAVSAYIDGEAPFAQALAEETAQASWSGRRFMKLEGRILATEVVQRVYNLQGLCNHLHLLGVPNLPRAPYEQSLWLRDRANAPALANVQTLLLSHPEQYFTGIPDEIDALTNLSSLYCFASPNTHPNQRLRTLPDTFGNLTQLRSLTLRGHDFREIPAALERLPRLDRFSILENTTLIRVFPERLARNQYGGFWDLFADFSDACNPIPHRMPADGVRHFAWLPRNQFTDIPFFLWFREMFSLPYINTDTNPCMNFLNYISNVLGNFIERDLGLWFGRIIVGALLFPIIVPLWLITALLDLSIFAYNLFVNLAIEPIVTFVRENLLGYSPMTHIRDIPAGGAG